MAQLLDPNDPRAPKYWMDETSGVVAPAIARYLKGEGLTSLDVHIVRLYLQQWIDAPVWEGADGLEVLRLTVRRIRSQSDIEQWLADAWKE